jgi:hypothetical protein
MKTTYLHFLLLFGLAACGGSKANVLDSDGGSSGSPGSSSGTSGTSGGSSGTSGTSGSSGLPAVSCGNDNVSTLSGTWSLIGTQNGGSQSSAELTIDGSTFAFTAGAQSLTFTANGGVTTLVWQDGGRQSPINSQHTSSTLGGGLIPLALGGQWSFASPTGPENCIGSVSPTEFNGSCNHAPSPWGSQLDGSLVAQRTSQASSIFGDLGGTWHMTSNQGTAFDSSFVGNTFTSTVSGAHDSGTVTIKICADSLSGVTSGGFEIAGTRR